MVLGAAL
jgi:hypothetical protein